MHFNIISDVSQGFKNIDAICQFEYKGFLVSISTAGRSKGACTFHVCIFSSAGGFLDVVKDGFYTVEEAIQWIENNC